MATTARPTLIDRDLAVLWHPCSQMRDYQDFPPLEVVGAAGCRLRLGDGREILDAISSWWCKSLGHGHARLRAALIAQADRFEHVILANTTNQPIVQLCERLLALANGNPAACWGLGPPPPPSGHDWFTKVFFADNGSTAVEVALKLSLQAQAQLGQPQRRRFAALANGYHGESAAALSVGDCELYKRAYTPMLFPCLQLGPLPYRSGPEDPAWEDCAGEWAKIEGALAPHAHELAAVIYEPVLQGAGGMRIYSPDMLRRLRCWADDHGILLIADEIMAGLGRCGAPLASHLGALPGSLPAPGGHGGVLPDLAVLGKGLTGGFLPLACVLTTERLYQAFYSDWQDGRAFLHSNTFAGNALAVAVANALLEAFAAEDVLGAVARQGQMLRTGIRELAARRPYFEAPRGLGMVAAVDLCQRPGMPLPAHLRTGWRVYREAVARGALLRPLGDTMYLCPPLNTSAADLTAMLGILADSCEAVLG